MTSSSLAAPRTSLAALFQLTLDSSSASSTREDSHAIQRARRGAASCSQRKAHERSSCAGKKPRTRPGFHAPLAREGGLTLALRGRARTRAKAAWNEVAALQGEEGGSCCYAILRSTGRIVTPGLTRTAGIVWSRRICRGEREDQHGRHRLGRGTSSCCLLLPTSASGSRAVQIALDLCLGHNQSATSPDSWSDRNESERRREGREGDAPSR